MTTVVQFSGGIDSLVALWMHKGRADTCALWIKTDGAYPGAQERVEAACKAAGLPLYIEYTAREHLAYGFPADVVTQDLTALGALCWVLMGRYCRALTSAAGGRYGFRCRFGLRRWGPR